MDASPAEARFEALASVEACGRAGRAADTERLGFVMLHEQSCVVATYEHGIWTTHSTFESNIPVCFGRMRLERSLNYVHRAAGELSQYFFGDSIPVAGVVVAGSRQFVRGLLCYDELDPHVASGVMAVVVTGGSTVRLTDVLAELLAAKSKVSA